GSRPSLFRAVELHAAERARGRGAGGAGRRHAVKAPHRQRAAGTFRGAAPRVATAPWVWWVACAALAMALLGTALWWRTVRTLDGLTIQLTQLRERQDAQALAAVAQAAAAAATPAPAAQSPTPQSAAPAAGTVIPSDSRPLVVPVPYGADALGGARLELIGK